MEPRRYGNVARSNRRQHQNSKDLLLGLAIDHLVNGLFLFISNTTFLNLFILLLDRESVVRIFCLVLFLSHEKCLCLKISTEKESVSQSERS